MIKFITIVLGGESFEILLFNREFAKTIEKTTKYLINWDKSRRLKPVRVEDLIQIVTVFSCRLQCKRANKAKKMIKELLGNDTCKEN